MKFHGAKVAVFIGTRLLTYLRDDFDHIPNPARWDFAGGGREGDEAPEACVLRELHEEFGLILQEAQLQGKTAYETQMPQGRAYFFVAHLPAEAEADVAFADEGQRWALMDPDTFLSKQDAVGHLQDQLRVYLERL